MRAESTTRQEHGTASGASGCVLLARACGNRSAEERILPELAPEIADLAGVIPAVRHDERERRPERLEARVDVLAGRLAREVLRRQGAEYGSHALLQRFENSDDVGLRRVAEIRLPVGAAT